MRALGFLLRDGAAVYPEGDVRVGDDLADDVVERREDALGLWVCPSCRFVRISPRASGTWACRDYVVAAFEGGCACGTDCRSGNVGRLGERGCRAQKRRHDQKAGESEEEDEDRRV